MNIKFFILVAVIAGAVCFLAYGREPGNQKKVDGAIAAAALETTQKSIEFAQSKNTREFVKLTFDFYKNRSNYYESYQLLQNIRLPENADWRVREDVNTGTINVSCKLDKNRKLLIVLRSLPDKTMRLACACTLNS